MSTELDESVPDTNILAVGHIAKIAVSLQNNNLEFCQK